MARILLMEPDRLLARAYTSGLAAAGHEVHWQTDAQLALDVIDQKDIELIILELQLAPHNGVELLYELRSYPDWDNIAVLLHTMVTPDHPGLGKAFWSELGIKGYLYKPQTSVAGLVKSVQKLTTVPA